MVVGWLWFSTKTQKKNYNLSVTQFLSQIDGILDWICCGIGSVLKLLFYFGSWFMSTPGHIGSRGVYVSSDLLLDILQKDRKVKRLVWLRRVGRLISLSLKFSGSPSKVFDMPRCAYKTLVKREVTNMSLCLLLIDSVSSIISLISRTLNCYIFY